MQPDCKGGGKTSYMPVDITEPFSAIFARLSAQKPEVTREHMALITDRIVGPDHRIPWIGIVSRWHRRNSAVSF